MRWGHNALPARSGNSYRVKTPGPLETHHIAKHQTFNLARRQRPDLSTTTIAERQRRAAIPAQGATLGSRSHNDREG